MGVLSWFRRKPTDGSSGAGADAPDATGQETAAGAAGSGGADAADTCAAQPRGNTSEDGAGNPEGPAAVATRTDGAPGEAREDVEIPQQQSASEAAATESGDGART